MAIMHITTTTYPIPPERDGTMALITYVVSEDAKYLAYALSSSRRDWITVKGQSCLHAPSTCCGPDVCDVRTSYVSRQCTSSDGDSAAPCLLRRLATPDWLTLAS
ncbi:hypothetical protein Tco_1562544 [Tanacetum coccineum]